MVIFCLLRGLHVSLVLIVFLNLHVLLKAEERDYVSAWLMTYLLLHL